MNVETCNITQAAKMLYCHHSTVRDLIRSGRLPAAKIGRAWVILTSDILELLRQVQNESRLSMHGKGKPCHCTNAKTSGGYTSQGQTVRELDALLGLPTKGKPRNITIN